MVVCKGCGLEHSSLMRCEVARRMLGKVGEKVVIEGEKKETVVEAPTSKRWDKGAYNAYMKVYMRSYRARKG